MAVVGHPVRPVPAGYEPVEGRQDRMFGGQIDRIGEEVEVVLADQAGLHDDLQLGAYIGARNLGVEEFGETEGVRRALRHALLRGRGRTAFGIPRPAPRSSDRHIRRSHDPGVFAVRCG
jgi:hypothetical protein